MYRKTGDQYFDSKEFRNLLSQYEKHGIIAGIVISRTGLHVIDPAISLLVAAVILFNTFRLLLDALRTLFRK